MNLMIQNFCVDDVFCKNSHQQNKDVGRALLEELNNLFIFKKNECLGRIERIL
jgi:hypothetical protein